jgi:hypothetical protein
MTCHTGSGGIAPPFLTWAPWRRMVSFWPRPYYPWVKRPRYPFNRWLSGPQSRSGRCGEEKNFSPAGNRIPVVQPVARRYINWANTGPHNGGFYKCMCLKHTPEYFESFECSIHQYTQCKKSNCQREGLWTGMTTHCFSICRHVPGETGGRLSETWGLEIKTFC